MGVVSWRFMGGGIANPSNGSSHRCHMYEKYYEYGPNWDEWFFELNEIFAFENLLNVY